MTELKLIVYSMGTSDFKQRMLCLGLELVQSIINLQEFIHFAIFIFFSVS